MPGWHDQAHEHRSRLHRRVNRNRGGRDGHVKSTDGRIDLDTRPPKEMGGSGEGANPEQLFSAGFVACFLGALRLVARNEKIDLDDATGITAQVGFGRTPRAGSASTRT